ncbi:MAG TPA: apolipoprotein N-acyltransferase [Thermohalobaculum sp.]|nr:apolipoprotein N-acyltransferase [Thermohalobaculum sp.]
MTAAQPPLSQPWVLFAALPLVVWLVDAAPGHAFLTGWAVAFGYFTTGLYWIGHAFLVDAARFAWMMPFAVTILPAFLGLFWGAAFWAAARRWTSPWTRVLVLAGWLTLIEYARAKVLTGFPWALPAYAWTETPVAQALAWIGPFGLTLATLALAALPAIGLAGRGVGGRIAAAVALSLLAGLWLAGAERLAKPPPAAPDAPVLRVVQPNATQKLKWHPDWAPVFYRRLLDESAAPASPSLGPPDAVIWPETAVPFLPAEAPERLAEIAAAGQGAPVILGALHRQAPGGRLSNSLMVLADGAISARYDKHHLVPFGEYLPYPWLFAPLGFEKLVPGAGFDPGPGPRVLEAPGLPPFSALVCYEMIFPDEVVPDSARPAWLLQVTNDAWFGAWGGPQQHLAQARARAIEQGLPVVRAANTGVSAHIDAHGRLLQTLGLDRHGRLDFRLAAPLPPTPYVRMGDWPALVLALVLGVFPLSRRIVTVE